jgi:hypothetical protein
VHFIAFGPSPESGDRPSGREASSVHLRRPTGVGDGLTECVPQVLGVIDAQPGFGARTVIVGILDSDEEGLLEALLNGHPRVHPLGGTARLDDDYSPVSRCAAISNSRYVNLSFSVGNKPCR